MKALRPDSPPKQEVSIAKRFIGGAVWSVLGAVLTSGINLVVLMFVSRYLGKELYGQFTLVQSTLASFGIFAGFGVGAASVKFIAELRFAEPQKLRRVLALSERIVILFGSLAALGLAFGSELIARKAFDSPAVSQPLSIAAVAVALTTADGYQKSVMVGLEAMKKFFISSVVGVILCAPLILVLSSVYSLEGACWALVISAFFQCVISRVMMKKLLADNGLQLSRSDCWSEKGIIWRFSLPSMLAGAMVIPSHWIVNTFLVGSPGGYSQLAVFGIAMQWFNVIMFVPGTAGRVVLPILTDHIAKKDSSSSKKILGYAMVANGIVAIPIAFLVSVLSQRIMSMYGDGYANENNALIIAVFVAVLVAVLAPVGNLLAATSRMWLGFLMNAMWAFIYLVGAYFLVGRGAVGALTALAIAYIFHSVWTIWYATACAKLKG